MPFDLPDPERFRNLTDRDLLAAVAGQLRRWADESRSGGWSTHQVESQRQLAAEIDRHLAAPEARKDR